MRLTSLLDSRTAANVLASQRRRGNQFRTDDAAQLSSVLGRISAVGSLMPTKKIGECDGFGFLADVSVDPAPADGQQPPPPSVPVLLCGRRFLGLFASLGIGDSLFISGLLPMSLHIEGSDSASMFVTSPESRAYRIDDFDGLEDARVRLPVLPQQPFTHASQDSLLSRIEPSNATAGTSERVWPQSLDQPTLIDERRILAFGACARSSVRIVEFADTADHGPMNSVIAGHLAAYVAKRAGGLVRMVEAIEAFWRLQVKFPDGLSAERESSQLKTSECAIKIMDLALRLVGHPQPSATGKPYSYRRLYLEFLDHGRCTSVDCMRGQLVSRVISLGDVIQRFLLWRKEHQGNAVSLLAQRSSKPLSSTSVAEEVQVTNIYPAELSLCAFPLIGRLVLRQRGILCLQDATGWLQIRPTAISTEPDDPEMACLEFTGQALVGHAYSWGHWRLATELVNAMTVSGGIGVSTGCSAAPFELIYAVAANPTILYADHNFGCGSKARRSTNAGVAQSILLLVHSQSPVAISPFIKKSKSSSDGSCSSSSSSSGSSDRCRARTRTCWISVKGAGLKIDYPEFHKHIESNGDGGSDGGALRFNISEATELLTCVISYDPDQLPVSLTPGCAYVVCVADPSTITYYGPSGRDVQVELESSSHVHPAWVTVSDCSDSKSKPYVARQHHGLLARALDGDQPLCVPTIQIDAAGSSILGLYCPPPVYPVRELHSLLANVQQVDVRVDGNSRPIDIVSVYGTIAKRVIKQAVAFTSGSLGNSGPGKKRSKDHSDSAGLLAGRFDTRIVLHDDRDNESAVTLYIELSSFAHPLGLVPGTCVVVRDARLDLAKGTGRAYLRGAAGTSFQLMAARQAPDIVVQVPSQATRGAETEYVSIGQLCDRHTNKVSFHCSVSAFELLRISVSCKECKQTVRQALCACPGRQHRIADMPAAVLARIELICRVADGSGVVRLLVTDEAALAETLGLAATEATRLFGLAARTNEGQLLWAPQLGGLNDDVVNIISHAVAGLSTVSLRVEGTVQMEQLSHLEELRQPLRFGGQPVLVRQRPIPKVSVLRITRLTTSALCWQLLAALN
ncbi:hypothetical protein GGI10_001030 [Coemansia sp. RSA 2530]|nr:hypothetical protein GGI10_001030 [Coemansia sp. RSA 2530]